MNLKKLVKICSLAIIGVTLSVTSVSFLAFNNENVLEVNATQHAENYDEYDYKSYSGTYYNSITPELTEGLSGTLRTTLTSLICPTQWYTYSGTGSNTLAEILQSVEQDPTNKSNMVYLYTRDSVTKNAASSWNREHCWPQNLSGNCWGTGSGGGSDLYHIKPTYPTTNSTRSNYKYGTVEVTSSTTKTYNSMVYGYTSSSKFMPLDSVKGDVARIIMYMWVAYKDYYPNLPNITNVFESYDTLLSWHTQDKPDVLEANRNEVGEKSKQANRNPFVDHPEYAWKIFGDSCSSLVKEACQEAYPEQTSKNLTSIVVDSSSVKTTYNDYEQFDPTGIKVTAYFDDSTSTDVTKYVTYDKTELRYTDTKVTVSYKFKDVTKSSSINVTVNQNPVTGISLDLSKITLEVGSFRTLVATITPSNASNKNVIWSSSNSSVCSVSNATITANKKGTAVITAKSEDGNYTATCNVTVADEGNIPVTGINLDISNKTIGVSKSFTLTPTISPSDATNKNVIWTSSNDAIASVSNGEVTGVSVGDAVITAKSEDGEFSASCSVTVSNAVASEWTLVTSTTQLVVGNKYVIASNAYGKVATNITSSTMGCETATFSSDTNKTKITSLPESAVQFTLSGATGAWVLNSTNGKLGTTEVKKLAWNNGTTTWNISFSTTNTVLSSTVSSCGTLQYNSTTPRFTTYTSTQKSIQLYVNDGTTSLTAETWSTLFVTDLTCDNGKTKPSKSTWSNYETLYGTLSSEEQTKLKDATYSLSGSVVTPLDDTNAAIAEAVARYDYIIAKYGTSDYSNFISRDISSNIININVGTNNDCIFVVLIASSILFVSLTTFVIIKKRKIINK